MGRLPRLADNRGRGPAPLVWMALCSHLRWGSTRRTVYAGNARLARLTGMSVRMVEYGVAWLKRAGFVAARYGGRWRYGRGRILRLNIEPGPAPKVVLPKPKILAEIWRRCRRVRTRATALVTLAVAAHVHAVSEHRKPGKFRRCSSKIADLARFIGASRGGTLNSRLADLDAIGLVRRRRITWAGGFIALGNICLEGLRLLAADAEAIILLGPARMASVTSTARLASMSSAQARAHAS